jgi:hypothetical protein
MLLERWHPQIYTRHALRLHHRSWLSGRLRFVTMLLKAMIDTLNILETKAGCWQICLQRTPTSTT